MKKQIIAGGLAVVLAAAAGVAAAQQAEPRAQRSARVQAAPVDQAAFVERRVARLVAADANGDGRVTAEEMRAAAQAHRAERTAARFDRLDADRDGVISRAEFEAAPAMRGGRKGPSARHMGPRAHGEHTRTDRMRGARAQGERSDVVIAEARTRAADTFARLDADNDGVVTAEERRAGAREMREQRRERMVERRGQRAAPSTPAPSE